ncbi:MAG: molybdopterin-guanine dinucleotide biosynthesis protein B [Bacillota bacterium]|jgi:molybdopterin-guanine dinucleotide biosynthesis protein B
MKIFAVSGVSGSGKTTVIEMIIKELKGRGYRVGSIKDIHFKDFTIDQAGSNTWRHLQAGAEQVIARGLLETDILIPRRMEYEELVAYFDQDFLVIEGMPEAQVPRILCAHQEDELKERWTDYVFAVSGRIVKKISGFRDVPAVNALTDIKRLADLVEENALVKG